MEGPLLRKHVLVTSFSFSQNPFDLTVCFEFAGVARWIASGQIRIGAGNLTNIHFLFFGDRFLVGPLEKSPEDEQRA